MAETTATKFGPGNYPDLAPGGQYEGAQIGTDLGAWDQPGIIVGQPFVDDRGFTYDWKTGDWIQPAPEVEQPPTTEYKPVDLSQPFTPAMREPMAAPTGVRFNLKPEFGPVTPSGYAQPPVDPLSYYQGPTTMASGGGGGFDNLGGGFKGTTTPSVGIMPSTTPSGGGATTTPSPGFTYNPGQYDPSTGIGVVYTPGPDEQITPQPTTKPTSSPWSSAVVPGGGVGGSNKPIGPDNPLRPDRPGSDPYTGRFFDKDGNEWDYDRGEWIYAKLPDTPLVGPRFETEPVTVTIPVEQKQPTTTPATKTETTTTAPAETKPTTTTSPIRQTKIEVPQRPVVQIPKPTIMPGITAQYEPFNFNEPPPSQPFKEPITVPADINRKVPPYRTGFQYINYDPEEILAAAMRSMGGSRARQSIAEEAQIFNRMRNR